MLTTAQVREFFDVGFLIQPDVFTTAEVASMRAAFERLEHTAYELRETQIHRGSQFVLQPLAADGSGSLRGGVRINRIVWCGAAEPVLSDFGQDQRLLEMAGAALGSDEMHQLINQAHFKFPGDGVEFPWHQDSSHRRYGRGEWTDVNGVGSFVQTVTAIDDLSPDNGTLQLIPGSSRLGHVERAACQPGWLPIDRIDPDTAVAVTMPAGSVLIMGPYTFHRSLPNRGARPRRVFINGFAYPGANSRVYPGEGAGRPLRCSNTSDAARSCATLH
jgi:ectoine hydroxylase-related dioxygenase (phytanoyl-CoA dioxygenase family)